VLAIAKKWQSIKDGAAAAVDWVRDRWNDFVGFFAGLPGRITSAASGMFDGLWQAFRHAINMIIDGWNGLHFSLPSIDTHIPGVGKIGGESVGVPQIPHLAQGGLITADGFIYAHAGEAITPAPGRTGPAVVIQSASFNDGLTVEAFMRRAAWVAQTQGL